MASSLSHQELITLFLAVGILLAYARIFGEIAQRLHQPTVLGEIIAGIFLGPTVFGSFFPQLYQSIFPQSGPVAITLNGVVALAITFFMLVAGIEVELATVLRQGRVAVVIGIAGIIVPFVVGFFSGLLGPEFLGAAEPIHRLSFALFFATAMSITALPVIAKILLDLNQLRSDLGVTIIAAAILNDLIGWLIFAFVLAFVGARADTNIVSTLVLTIAFTVGMLTVGRKIIDRVVAWIEAHASWPGGILGFAFTTTLLCAAFTEAIGLHAIFGAFLFGVALEDSKHLGQRTKSTIEQFVSFVFAPLFFASIGLKVNFVENFDLSLVIFVLLLATIGKVFGCTYAAKKIGLGNQEARAVGYGMNARGAMEIILGLIALNAGIIGQRLFVALVIMALVTSITSGMALKRSFKLIGQ